LSRGRGDHFVESEIAFVRTELWLGVLWRLVLSSEACELFCPESLDNTFVSCQLSVVSCQLLDARGAVFACFEGFEGVYLIGGALARGRHACIVPNEVAHFQHKSFHFF
jgi:hypothetical protein